ncbi:hypothetical protein M2375_003669 [Comamonas sp. BIGb0152]|uniref:DUF4124 domain-containing protein n=1 Tax=Comamonas sp. BIGb0152 TaxID=2940601 RepID=UPI00216840B2|nr:DUF4124 domain-containing protein [Comamonas sp. BIGb0152]MCS4295426.1 hypothetical protein [Comamonas sp. BIGb0152]
MKLIKLLLLSVAMGIGAPALAQWQWVDKDGRKVFSDRPPGLEVPEKNIIKRPKGYGSLKGVQSSGTGPALRDAAPAPQDGDAGDGAATPGQAAAPAPASGAPAAKAPTGKDRELEAKKAADAKTKADAEAAEKAKQAAAKADNCKRAQQAKSMYDTGKAVRAPNEKGEMVFQNAEQRAAEIKRTDEVIFNNC